MTRTTTRFAIESGWSLQPITSPWGNFLPLTDPKGEIVKDAAHIILGFMYFPDDLITAWAYVEANKLMADDPRLGDFQGDEPHVAKWIRDSVHSTLRQRQNAQIIGSVFLGAAVTKRPVSYRQAIYLTQRILDRGGQWQDKRHPRDLTGLRRAFDRFKPSIHLFLAMQVLKLEEWKSVVEDGNTLRRFLSAAAHIQAVLSTLSAIPNWRPWAIHPCFIAPNEGIDLTGFSEETHRLLGQYQAKSDREEN